MAPGSCSPTATPSAQVRFYCVPPLGAGPYSLPAACCVFVLAACRHGLPVGALVLVALSGASSLLLLAAYGALFGFHTYLAYLGIGTYDWIMGERNKAAGRAGSLLRDGRSSHREAAAASSVIPPRASSILHTNTQRTPQGPAPTPPTEPPRPALRPGPSVLC